MNLSFECVKCQADFDHDLSDLIKDPAVSCPNCRAKVNPRILEAAVVALDEAVSQLSRLSKSFLVSVSLESDDIEEELADEYVDDGEDEDSLWGEEPEEEDEEEE